MKTFTAQLRQNQQFETAAAEKLLPAMASSATEILASLSAASVATAIVFLSIWVAGMQMNALLGASTWVIGLIYLGLAVDNNEPNALLHLVTGTALLVLAWFGTFVSADFVIVFGLLLAMRVAVSLFKHLR